MKKEDIEYGLTLISVRVHNLRKRLQNKGRIELSDLGFLSMIKMDVENISAEMWKKLKKDKKS